jgi:hypothetical protein
MKNLKMPDTIGKLFRKILLTGIQNEISGQFWLPQNSTALQLAVSLRETGTLTGSKEVGVSLDAAKTFDEGLLYKQTIVNFRLLRVCTEFPNDLPSSHFRLNKACGLDDSR